MGLVSHELVLRTVRMYAAASCCGTDIQGLGNFAGRACLGPFVDSMHCQFAGLIGWLSPGSRMADSPVAICGDFEP